MSVHSTPNALINESSPYLLQHAYNPVKWYPWGKEALQKAREENKLMIISIGYAACHWCHVMERESFEDLAVADVMNEHFISIKVDREERPDIDAIYMNAVMLISGQGGWPLNAIALPDGRPVYAGTYFPKQNWIKVLEYFNNLYLNEREKLELQAEQVKKGIRQIEMVPYKQEKKSFTALDADAIFHSFRKLIDFKKGGKAGAPKFPLPNNFEFLLHYYSHSENEQAFNAVKITLDNLAFGGIFDQIGGGFARYSVDEDWLVPHFEKMLYDNGQLVSLFSKFYQLTKDELYKETVYQTLQFIENELTSPEGGFYASLDADSEGEEGKFYVFTKEEIDAVLQDDAALFNEYYNIEKGGNWEHGKNILHRKLSDKDFAEKKRIDLDELKNTISGSKKKLMNYRSERIRPGLDDKILTSWNALMLNGFIDAYRAFGEEDFLRTAVKNARFLEATAIHDDYRIYRNYKNGKSTINGFLDDYSFLAEAFINLYQATFDEHWLHQAMKITEYAIAHFYDEKSGMFYYTSDLDDALIARKMELSDNVIPSSNSSMAKVLFQLGHYFNDEGYIKKGQQMLTNVFEFIKQQPSFYSNWANLLLWEINTVYEVAITGEKANEKRQQMDQYYLPNALFSGGKEGTLALLEGKFNDKTMIYVCRNKSCKYPVESVEEALKLMKE